MNGHVESSGDRSAASLNPAEEPSPVADVSGSPGMTQTCLAAQLTFGEDILTEPGAESEPQPAAKLRVDQLVCD